MKRPACFLAQHGNGDCSGPMDRAHLMSKSFIKRQFPHGALLGPDNYFLPVSRTPGQEVAGYVFIPTSRLVWDERLWVHACRHHHADWDNCRYTVPRSALPASFIEFAERLGLTARLDHDFPEDTEVSDAAAA